jgi:hypothetical protein
MSLLVTLSVVAAVLLGLALALVIYAALIAGSRDDDRAGRDNVQNAGVEATSNEAGAWEAPASAPAPTARDQGRPPSPVPGPTTAAALRAFARDVADMMPWLSPQQQMRVREHLLTGAAAVEGLNVAPDTAAAEVARLRVGLGTLEQAALDFLDALDDSSVSWGEFEVAGQRLRRLAEGGGDQ